MKTLTLILAFFCSSLSVNAMKIASDNKEIYNMMMQGSMKCQACGMKKSLCPCKNAQTCKKCDLPIYKCSCSK